MLLDHSFLIDIPSASSFDPAQPETTDIAGQMVWREP